MTSPGGGQPFTGAFARVDRAGEHIGELRSIEAQSGRWIGPTDAMPGGGSFAERPPAAPGELQMSSVEMEIRIPGHRDSVLIGEAVYNLRAALDYTVYALACAGAGGHVSGTQFPVDDDRATFDARKSGKGADGQTVRRFLKHVPDGDVKELRKLQPFAGCTWPKTLTDLANPDKHTRLNYFTFTVAESEPVVLKFVETDDPVIETLELFQREVRTVVQSFESAMKSRTP